MSRRSGIEISSSQGTEGEIEDIPFRLTYIMAVAPYNFCNLEPKCSKCPFIGSKITKGDIRLYFKIYEKNSRWRHY